MALALFTLFVLRHSVRVFAVRSRLRACVDSMVLMGGALWVAWAALRVATGETGGGDGDADGTEGADSADGAGDEAVALSVEATAARPVDGEDGGEAAAPTFSSGVGNCAACAQDACQGRAATCALTVS